MQDVSFSFTRSNTYAYFGESYMMLGARERVVSFAAVIRVVTRHATLLPTSGEERCVTSDDPNNGCEGD